MYVLSVRDSLKSEIAKEMQKIADRITSGSAHTVEEYRQLVGRIQGMRDSLSIIDAQFNKLLNEGDEA